MCFSQLEKENKTTTTEQKNKPPQYWEISVMLIYTLAQT